MNSSQKPLLKRHKLLASVTILVLMACGPHFDWSDFESYFQPQSATTVSPDDRAYDFSPLFFATDSYVAGETEITSSPTDSAQIMTEWKGYFKGRISDELLETFLYGNDSTKKAATAIATASPLVASYFAQLKTSNNTGEEWDQKLDEALLAKKLTFFKSNFESISNDKFMKERFGLQVLEVLTNTNKAEEALDFYAKEFLPIASKSAVSVRAKAWAAGATLRLNKAKGFYEFAQIFDQYPHLRYAADLSVRANNIKFDEKVLDFCKNPTEKAACYALASIQPLVDASGFIEQILAIQPNHPMLEFLMAREINRNEFYYFKPKDKFLSEKEWTEEGSPSTTKIKAEADGAKVYFEKLKKIALTAANSKQVKRPAFWLTAAAHCAYLGDADAESRELLTKAQGMGSQEAALTSQQALQEMLLLTRENKQVTPAFEAKIIPLIETFHARKNRFQARALASTSRYMASLYDATEQKPIQPKGWLTGCGNHKETKVWQTNSGVPFAKGKALFFRMMASEVFTKTPENELGTYYESQDQFAEIEETTAAEDFNELLLLAEQKELSVYDEKIVKYLNVSRLKRSLGQRLLAEHQYEKAFAQLSALPNTIWKEEKYESNLTKNPFNIGLDQAGLADPKTSFTAVDFVKKMDELHKKSDAEALYFLGCGAYNLSYWGKAWILVRNSRSNYDIENDAPVYSVNPLRNVKNDDYYQLKTTEKYFKDALAKAVDRELKAKISYGLALVERSKFELEYAKNAPAYGQDWEAYERKNAQYEKQMQQKRHSFETYFEQIKNNFTDTQFQKMMLKECSTYEHFASGK